MLTRVLSHKAVSFRPALDTRGLQEEDEGTGEKDSTSRIDAAGYGAGGSKYSDSLEGDPQGAGRLVAFRFFRWFCGHGIPSRAFD